MKASVAERDITAEEYLMVWIGSLGRFLGFDIPLVFVKE
jgi:ubiquitin-like-conjugating enzyme ATG10